jgi:hypothetical protein
VLVDLTTVTILHEFEVRSSSSGVNKLRAAKNSLRPTSRVVRLPQLLRSGFDYQLGHEVSNLDAFPDRLWDRSGPTPSGYQTLFPPE